MIATQRCRVRLTGMRRMLGAVVWLGMVIGACIGACGVRGATIQFDVFLGYGSQPTGMDGLVREGSWFLVACEVHNSGPSFDAIFELAPGQFGRGQIRRFVIELPANTRKRFTIPAFASAGYYSTWDARLLDERGVVQAERTGLRPRVVVWETLLMGALPRTLAGLPRLPSLPDGMTRGAQQPISVRLLTELMPEDAIALEGLDALYVNSEKALELRVPQAVALRNWVLGGGHLIVAVEDPAEVNSLAWLRDLIPAQLGTVQLMQPTEELMAWGRPLVDPVTLRGGSGMTRARPGQGRRFSKYRPSWLFVGDPGQASDDGEVEEMAAVEFPVATSELTEGEVLLAIDGTALITRCRRGLGQVTLMTFSPDREPFRSWESREWFWARLLGIPPEWYEAAMGGLYGGQSVDGLFGMMIDSRQVRKLPITWLLLLLVVYLVVIGPLDRYLLRRARREMLTWVTFPAYVVLFTLLIYYIGYRLRAGDSEWNELHVVDVVPWIEEAQWRGRTYASIYSPVPARYRLASHLDQATLRGEYFGMGVGAEASQIDLTQRGAGFDAEVFVPVWTSRLCVSDWLHGGAAPFHAAWIGGNETRRLQIRNQLPLPIGELWVVHADRAYELGALEVGATREVIPGESGSPLRSFMRAHARSFAFASHARNRAFGADGREWAEAGGGFLTAISFIGELEEMPGSSERQYLFPAGLDLSPVAGRGDAVILAWVPGYGPVPSLRQFKAVRKQENTFFRMAIPAEREANR
jgi:hypothetical protein